MTPREDPSSHSEQRDPSEAPLRRPADDDGAPSSNGSPNGRSPNVRPTGPGPLVLLGLAATVLGWAIRPLCIHLDRAEPVISAWTVAVVWLLAAAVGYVALRTWRQLQRPGAVRRLLPYQAVNRLVLGKAAAIAGAVVLGGYAGFAIAHLGITPTELSGQRLLRSTVAAVGGLGLLLAGLALERACRVRDDEA